MKSTPNADAGITHGSKRTSTRGLARDSLSGTRVGVCMPPLVPTRGTNPFPALPMGSSGPRLANAAACTEPRGAFTIVYTLRREDVIFGYLKWFSEKCIFSVFSNA